MAARILGLLAWGALAMPLMAQSVAPPLPARPPAYPYGMSIGIDRVKAVVAAAEAEARRENVHVAIAISGTGGDLIYFEQFDETSTGIREIALGKARFAARFRMPTSYVADMNAAGNDGLLRLPGAIAGGGGIPLVVDGKTVGAIGVSGSMSPPKDMKVAQAGVDALK